MIILEVEGIWERQPHLNKEKKKVGDKGHAEVLEKDLLF